MLPFAPGSFDYVIYSLAAHHIGPADFLKQAFRVLKEGGQIILAEVAASNGQKLPGITLLLRLAAFLYFLFKENLTRARIESEAVSHSHILLCSVKISFHLSLRSGMICGTGSTDHYLVCDLK
jgi:SAM-dependent methyltransferase